MPKRKIALTKTKKKGREGKEKLIENIRESINKYQYVYVLSHVNMTTNPFMKIRKDFITSKFFLGKNKVIQFALGRTPEDEFKDNLCALSKHIKEECCLLCTDDEEAEEYFKNYSSKDFARAGAVASKTIVLQKGTEAFENYSFAMEPQLRQLGLPTKLVRQKITLLKDMTIAEEGKRLSSEECKILKHLGYKLAEFKLNVIARCNSKTHEVEVFNE